jgi:hypothetical protein
MLIDMPATVGVVSIAKTNLDQTAPQAEAKVLSWGKSNLNSPVWLSTLNLAWIWHP